MLKRLLMMISTMLLAIIAVLIAARYPTGPNTVSFDRPVELWLSVGMLVVLFIPPLIFAFFNNPVTNIISVIYQSFIVLSFLILIPVGFIAPSFWVSGVGILGTIVSICSIIVTVLTRRKKNNLGLN